MNLKIQVKFLYFPIACIFCGNDTAFQIFVGSKAELKGTPKQTFALCDDCGEALNEQLEEAIKQKVRAEEEMGKNSIVHA